jgi:hypothetical protein
MACKSFFEKYGVVWGRARSNRKHFDESQTKAAPQGDGTQAADEGSGLRTLGQVIQTSLSCRVSPLNASPMKLASSLVARLLWHTLALKYKSTGAQINQLHRSRPGFALRLRQRHCGRAGVLGAHALAYQLGIHLSRVGQQCIGGGPLKSLQDLGQKGIFVLPGIAPHHANFTFHQFGFCALAV